MSSVRALYVVTFGPDGCNVLRLDGSLIRATASALSIKMLRGYPRLTPVTMQAPSLFVGDQLVFDRCGSHIFTLAGFEQALESAVQASRVSSGFVQ